MIEQGQRHRFAQSQIAQTVIVHSKISATDRILVLQELITISCTFRIAVLLYITICCSHPLLIARILQCFFQAWNRDPLLAGFLLQVVEKYWPKETKHSYCHPDTCSFTSILCDSSRHKESTCLNCSQQTLLLTTRWFYVSCILDFSNTERS